jgi:hypothetical protein
MSKYVTVTLKAEAQGGLLPAEDNFAELFAGFKAGESSRCIDCVVDGIDDWFHAIFEE